MQTQLLGHSHKTNQRIKRPNGSVAMAAPFLNTERYLVYKNIIHNVICDMHDIHNMISMHSAFEHYRAPSKSETAEQINVLISVDRVQIQNNKTLGLNNGMVLYTCSVDTVQSGTPKTISKIIRSYCIHKR